MPKRSHNLPILALILLLSSQIAFGNNPQPTQTAPTLSAKQPQQSATANTTPSQPAASHQQMPSNTSQLNPISGPKTQSTKTPPPPINQQTTESPYKEIELKIVYLIGLLAIGLVGAGFKHWSDHSIRRKEQRLRLINDRIEKLYGPLYILTQSNKRALRKLIDESGGVEVFKNPERPTLEEQEQWTTWMRKVFMPINEKIEELILNNAYLIVDREMPECLLRFASHISEYKTIISQWDQIEKRKEEPSDSPIPNAVGKDLYQIRRGGRKLIKVIANTPFPKELILYAETNYSELKKQQLKYTGRI